MKRGVKKKGQVWIDDAKNISARFFSQPNIAKSKRGQVWIESKKISPRFLVQPNIAKSKRGQVWIETVIYTLIAFVILGAVLGFAKPKIEELQDKAIMEKSLEMLGEIDGIINEIKSVPGNKREIELGIKKGSLTINGEDNLTLFEIDSRYMYSEPGEKYQEGNIIIYNAQIGDINQINATINYPDYNITWVNKDQIEILGKSSTSYVLFISNKGNNQINFEFK